MARKKRATNISDLDVKRYNHVGIGLGEIGKKLNCNPVTVANRLRDLGIKVVDTRRSFMAQVFETLSQEEQDWLTNNLYSAEVSIHDFVSTLIKQAFETAPEDTKVAPAPVPELDGGSPEVVSVVEEEEVEDESEEVELDESEEDDDDGFDDEDSDD